ncbi:MAG: hypothetical protein K5872_18045 [Rhizobiaceae bacterium]|nr:hypothetical protein [Rhizobiaceae bacterium]MCV0408128.1 hypothetical protein [Rhizobiaceae bacterium]
MAICLLFRRIVPSRGKQSGRGVVPEKLFSPERGMENPPHRAWIAPGKGEYRMMMRFAEPAMWLVLAAVAVAWFVSAPL